MLSILLRVTLETHRQFSVVHGVTPFDSHNLIPHPPISCSAWFNFEPQLEHHSAVIMDAMPVKALSQAAEEMSIQEGGDKKGEQKDVPLGFAPQPQRSLHYCVAADVHVQLGRTGSRCQRML